MLGLSSLPIAVPPARHETVASYLARLAALHGMHPREIWEQVSTRRPGTTRRDVPANRLAEVTGRPAAHLAGALPELRDPAPDWAGWRHQPQPGCPRCDARHEGGPVIRLLPHHRYVCTRHGYWIGPPDAWQPATRLDDRVGNIIRAQYRHLRLARRHGAAAAFDAVLTGFLICGHLWAGRAQTPADAGHRWATRAQVLIPAGSEDVMFSASRIFAAVYPEAVSVAGLIAAPAWRHLAAGGPDEQRRFVAEIGLRLGHPDYRPPGHGDAIAHWMQDDSWRPPSRPDTTFPATTADHSPRPFRTNTQSLQRQARSAIWFHRNRLGGNVILHHRHIRPVLIREWSRPMDGIQATIWASRTTFRFLPSAGPIAEPPRRRPRTDSRSPLKDAHPLDGSEVSQQKSVKPST